MLGPGSHPRGFCCGCPALVAAQHSQADTLGCECEGWGQAVESCIANKTVTAQSKLHNYLHCFDPSCFLPSSEFAGKCKLAEICLVMSHQGAPQQAAQDRTDMPLLLPFLVAESPEGLGAAMRSCRSPHPSRVRRMARSAFLFGTFVEPPELHTQMRLSCCTFGRRGCILIWMSRICFEIQSLIAAHQTMEHVARRGAKIEPGAIIRSCAAYVCLQLFL